MGHWLKRLLPYAKGSAIWRALEKACDDRTFPSVGGVLEQIQQEQRRDTVPFVPPPALTTAEQIKADAAGLKSMLWLHYQHEFKPEHVGGIVSNVLGKLYASQTGKDATEAIEAAKLLPGHDRESILAWMAQQIAIGN